MLNRNGYTRYYAYLTKMHGELAQVTVACKNRGNKWFCKQVVVHGVHSADCLAKDINFFYMGGYVTGWYDEKLTQYRKWWETGKWGKYDDKYFNHAPVLNPESLSIRKSRINIYRSKAISLRFYTVPKRRWIWIIT